MDSLRLVAVWSAARCDLQHVIRTVLREELWGRGEERRGQSAEFAIATNSRAQRCSQDSLMSTPMLYLGKLLMPILHTVTCKFDSSAAYQISLRSEKNQCVSRLTTRLSWLCMQLSLQEKNLQHVGSAPQCRITNDCQQFYCTSTPQQAKKQTHQGSEHQW